MLNRIQLGVMVATLAAFGNAYAYDMTVDGDLSDWLLIAPEKLADGETNSQYDDNRYEKQYKSSNYKTWEPEHWTAREGVNSVIEDDNALINNRNYGGQAYDAEAMYSTMDNEYLYVAVVTGTKASRQQWNPGDLAIYVGNKEFNLETDSYNYGVETTGRVGKLADGSTPDFDSGEKGSFFNNPDWGKGFAGHDGADATSIIDGVMVDDAGVMISYSDDSMFWSLDEMGNYDAHYVLEAAIPLSLFGVDMDAILAGNADTLHYALSWTQNCGNDSVRLAGLFGPDRAGAIPEPATLVIMALGLVGIRYGRKTV